MQIPLGSVAAAAIAFFVGTGTAGAQVVIGLEPFETEAVVGQPLESVQRTTVYRTIEPRGRGRAPIVRERVVTERFAPARAVRPRVLTPVQDTGYAYAYVPPATPYGRAYVVTQSPQYVFEDEDDSREVANCQLRYRSYDLASRTFLGYDGLRHPCP